MTVCEGAVSRPEHACSNFIGLFNSSMTFKVLTIMDQSEACRKLWSCLPRPLCFRTKVQVSKIISLTEALGIYSLKKSCSHHRVCEGESGVRGGPVRVSLCNKISFLFFTPPYPLLNKSTQENLSVKQKIKRKEKPHLS